MCIKGGICGVLLFNLYPIITKTLTSAFKMSLFILKSSILLMLSYFVSNFLTFNLIFYDLNRLTFNGGIFEIFGIEKIPVSQIQLINRLSDEFCSSIVCTHYFPTYFNFFKKLVRVRYIHSTVRSNMDGRKLKIWTIFGFSRKDRHIQKLIPTIP